ncbi:hypothetical protein Dimus_016715 [Dionaea muscipula]
MSYGLSSTIFVAAVACYVVASQLLVMLLAAQGCMANEEANYSTVIPPVAAAVARKASRSRRFEVRLPAKPTTGRHMVLPVASVIAADKLSAVAIYAAQQSSYRHGP